MNGIVLFEEEALWQDMLPLSFTRPVAAFRTGILTQAERWQKILNMPVYFDSMPYLREKFPPAIPGINCFIHASVIATKELGERILNLKDGQALEHEGEIIARIGESVSEKIVYTSSLLKIKKPWDIFRFADEVLGMDFELMTKGRVSQVLSDSNRLIGDKNALFIEEGAVVEASVLNTRSGPIYIAENAEIMESCSVRGPFYLGPNSQLKMGAKIYGASIFGPHVKVGGEVNNSVIFGYSSKAHDGFLGNSVLGEWCNLGADTNNSNLKNNYAPVKLWNYTKEGFAQSGLQFCGLIMGDHSKSAINTMFNTGTVVGVSANIFGAGFPRNFIPSFSWGGPQAMQEYSLSQAVETAKRVFERRGMEFDEVEQNIFKTIFDYSQKYRIGL